MQKPIDKISHIILDYKFNKLNYLKEISFEAYPIASELGEYREHILPHDFDDMGQLIGRISYEIISASTAFRQKEKELEMLRKQVNLFEDLTV